MWAERDHMNIDMGIASDVLDLQNSDSFIHHCINHPHSFFHRLRESGKISVLCCRHLINAIPYAALSSQREEGGVLRGQAQ